MFSCVLVGKNVNHQAIAHAKTHHINRGVHFRIGKEVKGDLTSNLLALT